VNLSQDVRRVAKHLPHKLAITSDTGTITYAELENNVGRIAGGLRARLALTRGCRIGIAMDNCGEYLPGPLRYLAGRHGRRTHECQAP
jgi:acyl-CoA synthetase (AMP-forming)/AMP-acid ligase II